MNDKNQLTKREQFAKAAMQAIISNPNFSISQIIFDRDKVAAHCVMVADTVISKLEQTK